MLVAAADSESSVVRWCHIIAGTLTTMYYIVSAGIPRMDSNIIVKRLLGISLFRHLSICYLTYNQNISIVQVHLSTVGSPHGKRRIFLRCIVRG